MTITVLGKSTDYSKPLSREINLAELNREFPPQGFEYELVIDTNQWLRDFFAATMAPWELTAEEADDYDRLPRTPYDYEQF